MDGTQGTRRGCRGDMEGTWGAYHQEEGLDPAAEPAAGVGPAPGEHKVGCGDAGTGHPPLPLQQPQQHVGQAGLRLRGERERERGTGGLRLARTHHSDDLCPDTDNQPRPPPRQPRQPHVAASPRPPAATCPSRLSVAPPPPPPRARGGEDGRPGGGRPAAWGWAAPPAGAVPACKQHPLKMPRSSPLA